MNYKVAKSFRTATSPDCCRKVIQAAEPGTTERMPTITTISTLLRKASDTVGQGDELLRFIWFILQVEGPHGHSVEEVTTATLTEVAVFEALRRIRDKPEKLQRTNDLIIELTGNDDIVSVHEDVVARDAFLTHHRHANTAKNRGFEFEGEAVSHGRELLKPDLFSLNFGVWGSQVGQALVPSVGHAQLYQS
jgi:hypothetical protein